MLVIKVRNVTHSEKIKACNQAKYYVYLLYIRRKE